MKRVELPAYFSTLTKGKITLYIKKEYEHRLSANDIDILFNLHKDNDKLKVSYHGRTPCKTLKIGSLDHESFVVREYWHGGLFRKILRDAFWDGLRPLRELSICEAAGKSGIKTSEVIAIVKNRIMGPVYKCRLVSKEITGAIDLMELLLSPAENKLVVRKRQIINETAKAVKEMHDAGIYHADLHLKNILVQSATGGKDNVYIIDLDKSHQYEKINFHKRVKNIMRLDRSVEKMIRSNKDVFNQEFLFPISKTDKLRFLREYIKADNKSEKPLRYYLQSYKTSHNLHKLWWSVGGG
ncbi:MAG: 3-deoxy-D-manno-octulosonic acid kinase [Candidatus Scalindua arabica]|uniref:3-deoxy-D-manno-octulosonic acid kinase n=1 Tax=Candidatus Scalindua arabica TaxID=1127984 RepID=A0A942A6Z9_9BACT|nr:3-deoxy-D-manno-octulosonic acid kinase [Candidatus Scalindua arabica]